VTPFSTVTLCSEPSGLVKIIFGISGDSLFHLSLSRLPFICKSR
jgi:hypothetical protein